LWIAPGRVDAAGTVASLGLGAHVRVFHATTPCDISGLIADAYDLSGLSSRYAAFLSRWGAFAGDDDPLATRLRLSAEWLDAIRRDPRLPVEHLPPDWPAARAQRVFRELEEAYREPARTVADGLLDPLPLSSSG
jgi:phenylacetic acid degradation operon negative regulatory protein